MKKEESKNQIYDFEKVLVEDVEKKPYRLI